jgi:hypothetical protein
MGLCAGRPPGAAEGRPGLVKTGIAFSEAADDEWLRYVEPDRDRKPSMIVDDVATVSFSGTEFECRQGMSRIRESAR